MSDDILLEPLKGYKSYYKDAVNKEAEIFFDELVNKAGTDIEKNKATIKEMKKKQKQADETNKRITGFKIGRVFAIIGIVIAFLVALIALFLEIETYLKIIICICGVLIGVGFILLIALFINKRIRVLTKEHDKLLARIKELSDLAFAQMASLNALYDWSIPTKIIEKVIPMLDFDPYFDARKYLSLVKNYGFSELNDSNSSSLFVLSGTILGNPFLLQKARLHEIKDKVYTGTKVISWTEYYYDSEGHRRSRTRTQTLTATSTHPAPFYHNEVTLIYGNDAAPDLSFSRKPSGLGGMSEKEYDKYVKKHTDDLHDLAEKSLKRGDKVPFTPLANSEFELLFGAYNRNHNVQYRLLFTPLAQVNQVALIKSTDGFGDDYHFSKHKKINTISSSHSQNADYSANPSIYISNDYEWAKKNFVGYINYYFKNIYFDFAPLLSIPLYQQMKSIDYIYGEDAPYNYSVYEHEVFANSFDDKLFKDPKSITEAILKTRVISKNGKSDEIEVTAFSYRGEPRCDFVSVMGGDGKLHSVPVHWTEYFSLSKTSTMSLRNVDSTRFDFNTKLQDNNLSNIIKSSSRGGNYSFQRGLVATLGKMDEKQMDSIFKKDEQ